MTAHWSTSGIRMPGPSRTRRRSDDAVALTAHRGAVVFPFATSDVEACVRRRDLPGVLVLRDRFAKFKALNVERAVSFQPDDVELLNELHDALRDAVDKLAGAVTMTDRPGELPLDQRVQDARRALAGDDRAEVRRRAADVRDELSGSRQTDDVQRRADAIRDELSTGRRNPNIERRADEIKRAMRGE